MATVLIRRATLVSNVAIFETPSAEPWQIGQSVTTAGCSTSALNAAVTVLSKGSIQVSNGGINENWSGFSASITNADIPIESETGATVTSSFGTSTSRQSQFYDE